MSHGSVDPPRRPIGRYNLAGPNQHHIPAFVLRSFGVKRQGRPRKIWRFSGPGEPDCPLIKQTASEDGFYSHPSETGNGTVDDQITVAETRFSEIFQSFKAQNLGALVDAGRAVELIAHLAFRTSHFRSTFSGTFSNLMLEAASLFSTPDIFRYSLGLVGLPNTSRLTGHVGSLMAHEQVKELRLSEDLMTSVVYWMVRENFDTFFTHTYDIADKLYMSAAVAKTAFKSGHSQGVEATLGRTRQHERLEAFRWSVQPASPPGNILSDAVVIAYDQAGTSAPYMLMDHDDTNFILMPISPNRMLLGSRGGGDVSTVLASYNFDAARCADQCFYASENREELRSLGQEVGSRTRQLSDNVVKDAIGTYIKEIDLPPIDAGAAAALIDNAEDGPGFDVSFFDFGDEESGKLVAGTVLAAVRGLGDHYPVDAIDGFTFAIDLPAAVAALDRGGDDLLPGDVGPNDIASNMPIYRDGRRKIRVFLSASVAVSLWENPGGMKNWGMQMLVFQLILAGMAQLFHKVYPDIVVPEKLDESRWLAFRFATSAFDTYCASRFSEDFAEPSRGEDYGKRVAEILEDTRRTFRDAIAKYFLDGDTDPLFWGAIPQVRRLLRATSQYLGFCAAREIDFAQDEDFISAYRDAGLEKWLPFFRDDLEEYWVRRGAWGTFDQLFEIRLHTDRLFWQLGLFLWKDDEGRERFRVVQPNPAPDA